MNGRSQRILGYRAVQVLQLIAVDLAEQGRVRSYQQIAETLGMRHRSHVADVIGRLERRGLIRRIGEGPNRRIDRARREHPRTAEWATPHP